MWFKKAKTVKEEPKVLEVTLPNGLLLIALRTIDSYNIVNIADVEEKLKLIERAGLQTYEFGSFQDGVLKDTTTAILQDLLVYHSIGWVEVNKEKTACVFTQKGRCMAERLKVPESMEARFYSAFT